jgi:FolB domain-containing protein
MALDQPRPYWSSVLSDIQVRLRIGIHGHEQFDPQPVTVHVQLFCLSATAAYGQTLDQCIDYDPIRERVLSWQERAQIPLIEPLVRELAEECFRHALVDAVKIGIFKTEVFPETSRAGVEAYFDRNTWSAQ